MPLLFFGTFYVRLYTSRTPDVSLSSFLPQVPNNRCRSIFEQKRLMVLDRPPDTSLSSYLRQVRINRCRPIFGRASSWNNTPLKHLSRPILGSSSDYRCRPIFEIAPALPLLNASDIFAGTEFIELSNGNQRDALQLKYSRSRLLSHYRPKAPNPYGSPSPTHNLYPVLDCGGIQTLPSIMKALYRPYCTALSPDYCAQPIPFSGWSARTF